MTWTNLQEEVLEQFADPRWYGVEFRDNNRGPGRKDTPSSLSRVPVGIEVVIPEALEGSSKFGVVTRRSDQDFNDRVLETAATRLVWAAPELARLVGDATHSGECTVGQALASAAGWVSHKGTKPRLWVHDAGVLAWAEGRTDLSAAEVQEQTGVPKQIAARILAAGGWTVARKRVGAKWLYRWNKEVVV